MFLRSLTMKGFKSFADPTVLVFEPGVTVVVGPNGSGKSNVVDAVTWVLGAQGPRQLRSAKMEDVIFAGTASRAALGRAEVSLTIDNADGALPIESAEVTITRTLFRNGDSEYALNGTPCRLLDIQELLSDTGIGRSQHMIIGQGQLDAVLQATPENRRAIIEEAAGVLKHRRRRERAERRLAQTQENLERLGDLVREVRRQMRPLERQAVAARSHASLATDLREVRVYLAGLELTELTTKKTEAERGAAAAASDEAAVRAELDQLDAEASTTAAELSSRREEDLAGALGQIQGLAERARGTARVIVERQRAVVAALEASADVDVVSTLEAEVARLEAALAELTEDSASLEPSRAAVAAAEAALVAHDGTVDEAALLAAVRQASSSRAQAGARVAELERLVQDRRRGLEAARQRLAQAEARVARRTEADAALSARLEAAQANGSGLEQAARDAQQALEAAEAALGAAEQLATEAAEQAHRAQARAEALERALAELDGAAGRDALRGLAGVVGALVELVEIDEGWERAVEAAAGASVGAVVVEGRDAARAALSQLRALGTSGLVLTPSRAEGTTARGALGGSAQPLRPHIRPRPGAPAQVGAVLDALFDRAVLVEVLDEAIELSLDRPDLVVVTAAGDRFSTSGWRVHSSSGVVTHAAVEQAQRHAEEARAATTAATAQRTAARSAVEAARADQREAARALDRHQAELDGAQRELAGGASDRQAANQAVVQAADELEAAQVALGQVEADLAAAKGALPDLDTALAAAEADAALARQQAANLDAERRSVNQQRRDLAVKEAELAERERVLEDRRRQIERRLEGHAVEREQAARRRERLERDGRVLARLKELVEAESDRLTAVLERLQGEYRTQVDAVRAGGERLERLRQKRAQLERSVAEISERLRNLEVETAEVGLKLAALVEHIERELGSTTTVVLGASCPELPAGVTAEAHAANLHAKLQSLGPINPLALEELSSLEERHRELDTQVADVRSARRELQEVVRTLDEEIVTTFAAAAADVNEHFSTLVAMLFPGGTGRLILTDPDDLLNTGVEIEVRPMGRNVRRVSLLSGGERSMAALAFSFAIFRSRPSPFYLMDEVEAALDDVNLHRFLGLVEEFRDEAQLIIVSHQKRTMETGDALYGVTMAPGGSSQVVSQKVLRERDATPA